MQHKEWNVRKSLYKTLTLPGIFMSKVSMLPWWQYVQANSVDVRKCRYIAKILLDCNLLKSCQYRYNSDVSDPYCDLCDTRSIEDIEHVLFRCTENNDERRRLWQNVKDNCPDPLYSDMMDMPIKDRVSFLLGGFSQFTLEWLPLYSAAVTFIHSLYMSRVKNR